MKKLPEYIYVRWDGETNEEFLNAAGTMECHAEMGEQHTVGTYQLVRTSIVSTKVVAEEKRGK